MYSLIFERKKWLGVRRVDFNRSLVIGLLTVFVIRIVLEGSPRYFLRAVDTPGTEDTSEEETGEHTARTKYNLENLVQLAAVAQEATLFAVQSLSLPRVKVLIGVPAWLTRFAFDLPLHIYHPVMISAIAGAGVAVLVTSSLFVCVVAMSSGNTTLAKRFRINDNFQGDIKPSFFFVSSAWFSSCSRKSSSISDGRGSRRSKT